MIEIDLKMTKDNQLVIMHDNTIDRTTDGKGKVSGLYVGRIAKVSSEKWIGKSYFSSNSDFGGGIGTDKKEKFDKHRWGYDYFQEVYKLLVKTQTIDQVVIKSGYAYEKVKAENGDVLDKVIYMPIVDLNNP